MPGIPRSLTCVEKDKDNSAVISGAVKAFRENTLGENGAKAWFCSAGPLSGVSYLRIPDQDFWISFYSPLNRISLHL